jgi:AcrR family transcriptional regulator
MSVNIVNMERRREILEATRDVFLEDGLDGVTMRKVAAKVGISAPALYRHFEGKDALLATVVDQGYQLFSKYLLRGLAGQTPLERLMSVGHHYLRFALEQREYYRLILLSWNQLELDKHRGREHPTEIPPTFQLLIDRVAECVRSGDFGEHASPYELAVLIFAQCHGLASMYLTGGLSRALDEAAFEALAHKLLGVLTRCLAPR